MSAKNSLPAGTATLVASRFFRRLTGLSLNRKLLTGWTTLPFSISQTPSRVRPVTVAFSGLTARMYQNRVTSRRAFGLGDQVFERLVRASPGPGRRRAGRVSTLVFLAQ